MTKRIDEFVSENRKSVKRLDATLVPVSGETSNTLTFSSTEFNIQANIEIYERDINNTLISGHPNPENGSGRGLSGDFRGSYSTVSVNVLSNVFVSSGRNIVSNSLAGQDQSVINSIAVGNGDSPSESSDTELDSQNGERESWSDSNNSQEAKTRANFLFNDYGDSVSEIGVYSQNDNIYNRLVISEINPGNDKEIAIEITFEVNENTNQQSIITQNGRNTIAQSFVANETIVPLYQYSFGTGTSEIDPSDTSLENPILQKQIQQIKSPETVTARTVVFTFEPSSQPTNFTEIGILDSNSNLVWKTNIEPYEKTENIELSVDASFRIK